MDFVRVLSLGDEEAELQLWRHVPEDLKPNSPETAEDLEEWLRLCYLPDSTTIF